MPDTSPRIIAQTVRPQQTAALMARTGLSEAVLRDLVHSFYGKVRADAVLGPIFDARIKDWPSHLERMCAFWSSVTLMTGRYSGAPVAAHHGLAVTWEHFERWLALFRETVAETCPSVGAAFVVDKAERIARSLHFAIADRADAVPTLR